MKFKTALLVFASASSVTSAAVLAENSEVAELRRLIELSPLPISKDGQSMLIKHSSEIMLTHLVPISSGFDRHEAINDMTPETVQHLPPVYNPANKLAKVRYGPYKIPSVTVSDRVICGRVDRLIHNHRRRTFNPCF
jgi:hypothetical protein